MMNKKLTYEEKMLITDLANRKLLAMGNLPVKLELDLTMTIGLIAQLQLALRHPQNKGTTAQMVERFVRETIERIDPEHGAVHQVLMMGFDPQMDEILVKCRNCYEINSVADGRCPNCLERICAACGCTDSAGCDDGCFWMPDGVCSTCDERRGNAEVLEGGAVTGV